MHLFLLRHGDADSSQPDASRQLTALGREQVRLAAQKIPAAVFSQITAIEHSPLTRARQTAELFREVAGLSQPLREAPGVTPDDPPATTAIQIAHERRARLFIGHNPHLSHLASLLLTGTTSGLELFFQPSACACLECYSPATTARPFGYWRLCWFVSPFA
jgi:phosphohistidine phosphatase SixA